MRREGSESAAPPRANPVEPFLAEQGVMILDGGLATELEARGHDLSDELWSARLLVDDPGAIRQIHLDYLVAGADCLVTASYQATIEGFVRAGCSESRATALLRSSVDLAVGARDDFWSDVPNRAGRLRPLVAASLGPYGASRADGSEYSGDYDLDERALVEFHRRRLALLAASGADLLALETIPSQREARALARLLGERETTWAWMSFSCRDGERLADCSDLAALIAELDPLPNLVAIGVNCTAPRFVAELLRRAGEVTAKPLIAYPNSGEAWDPSTRSWIASRLRQSWTASAPAWRALGARLLGGCCRTGPDEIRDLRARLVGV